MINPPSSALLLPLRESAYHPNFSTPSRLRSGSKPWSKTEVFELAAVASLACMAIILSMVL